MCSLYQCQRATAKAVAASKAARRNDSGSDSNMKAAPVFCVQVFLVHGVRDFDPGLLKGKATCNAVASDDFVLSCLVFGRFAEDDTDAGFKDVQWVDLDDLMTNLTDDQLKPLVKYEKALVCHAHGQCKEAAPHGSGRRRRCVT